MMNKTEKSYYNHLQPGTLIQGRWHQATYMIRRKLGSGAVGAVYLCENNGRNVALKMSDQSASMTVEVNVLKALNKVQGKRLGPYLLDIDDWKSPNGKTYTFYVMEYIEGISLNRFIRTYGTEWTIVFILQLLNDLERLHEAGWVFGDLKLDNLLITTSPPNIRWVDVGGTTQIGRAIKEYTEFYDRGYWHLGSRRAEPSYDLFALVMVFLHVFYPNRFSKTNQPAQKILQKIRHIQALRPYERCFIKAILGKYRSSSQMKADITNILYKRQKHHKKKDIYYTPIVFEYGGILIFASSFYMLSLCMP